MISEERYRYLLDAVIAYVSTHHDPLVSRFADSIRHWGVQWIDVLAVHLPAAQFLESTLDLTTPASRDLLNAFVMVRDILHWEQSYRKQDNVVSDDTLAGYGFAELVGKNGPFLSERVRCGIGLWQPGLTYPSHRHVAEEIYHVLAGSAEFTVGDTSLGLRGPGETVFVPSNTWHGFGTREDPVVLFYIWQGGDMREISTFARSNRLT